MCIPKDLKTQLGSLKIFIICMKCTSLFQTWFVVSRPDLNPHSPRSKIQNAKPETFINFLNANPETFIVFIHSCSHMHTQWLGLQVCHIIEMWQHVNWDQVKDNNYSKPCFGEPAFFIRPSYPSSWALMLKLRDVGGLLSSLSGSDLAIIWTFC